MSDSEHRATELPSDGKTLQFRFTRAEGFREIAADGIWFSVGPQKQIHLTSYSDSFALPELAAVDVDARGNVVGDRVLKQDTQWIQRRLGVDIVMTFEAAKAFHTILGSNLQAIEALGR